MSSTVEYTFNDYPNVQLLVYKGADGTYETDLDKILSDLIVGKNKYTEPIIIEKSVYNNVIGSFIIPHCNNKLLITPFLPSIVIHAKLRITEFVNNGNNVNAIKIPFHFLETPDIT